MTGRRRGWALTAAALLGCTACGGPVAGPADNGESTKPAVQVLADATAALAAAHSYHLVGDFTDQDGTFHIDFTVAAPGALQGTLTRGGVTAQVILSGGTAYIRGRAFFARVAGPAAAAVVGDRWVKVPASESLGSLGEFADTHLAARCLLGQHGTLSRAGSGSVGGVPTVTLRDAGDRPGTAPGLLEVAARGVPYPLRASQAGAVRPGGAPDPRCAAGGQSGQSRGSVALDRFDAVVSITPPADALDLSTLGG